MSRRLSAPEGPLSEPPSIVTTVTSPDGFDQ
jgi:hypothetical protein